MPSIWKVNVCCYCPSITMYTFKYENTISQNFSFLFAVYFFSPGYFFILFFISLRSYIWLSGCIENIGNHIYTVLQIHWISKWSRCIHDFHHLTQLPAYLSFNGTLGRIFEQCEIREFIDNYQTWRSYKYLLLKCWKTNSYVFIYYNSLFHYYLKANNFIFDKLSRFKL